MLPASLRRPCTDGGNESRREARRRSSLLAVPLQPVSAPHDRDDMSIDPSPIAWGDGERGVLLLHGLTGTPYEVRPFAQALARRGFAVRAPRLEGHQDLDALESSTWRQWYGGAEAAFEALRDGGRRRTVVLGFSLGALLSLRLAALRPRELQGLEIGRAHV